VRASEVSVEFRATVSVSAQIRVALHTRARVSIVIWQRMILFRVDMEDETGTAMCEECADDALDSGVFTTYEDVDEEEAS